MASELLLFRKREAQFPKLQSEGKSAILNIKKSYRNSCRVGCALTFASEAKFEIEAKILFHMIHFDAKHQKSEAKTKVK
jgi:hypothetical protein